MNVDGDARSGSLQGRLARLGFVDAARGVRLLSEPGLVGLGTAIHRSMMPQNGEPRQAARPRR